jgi:hypothetical protein
MAIGLRIKFDGGTQEQYDAVHGGMDIDSNPPEGLIFHSAGPIEDGWGVIDFWESRGAFDRFIEERLKPIAQELGERGFPTPPDVKEFRVYKLTHVGVASA